METTVVANATQAERALPPPDLGQAQRLLDAIDPDPAAKFGFRTVADRGDDIRLSVKAYGTLGSGARQSKDPSKNGKACRPANLLAFMQDRGVGAFFVPNKLDGAGQMQANVIAIRALYVDADTRAAVDQLHRFIDKTVVAPTALVASGGVDDGVAKLHAYWRIEGCPVTAFREAQLTLVSRLGTDPAVQDASRVMRLAGFWHQKHEPRQTRLISASNVAHDFASFIARVKAEPQICDPWARGAGRGHPTLRRTGGGAQSASAAGPTARLRVLLDASGGLITPAVRALLREAVAPTEGRPGNRHGTIIAVTARCIQAKWSDDDIRDLVLPVANADWGDGDWRQHLDDVIGWTRRQEAASVAAAVAAPDRLSAAFGAGRAAGGAR
jgi:hypothetical protein